MYFSASGTSSTTNGLNDGAAAKCIIAIGNTSNIKQTFTLKVTALADGSVSSGPATKPSGFTGIGTGTDPAVLTDESIIPLDAKMYEFTYPAFPASTIGSQPVSCTGSIVVNDATASPGHLQASGALIVFFESGQMKDAGNPNGITTIFKGIPTFTQMNISINGGVPF
jgi:hypothetical protein